MSNNYLDGGTGVDTGDHLLVPGEIASSLPGTVMGNPQIEVFSETENTNIVSAHLMTYVTDISSSDVTLRLGSLMLDLGNGDAIHLKNSDANGVLTDFNQNDVFNSASVGSFQFADGTTLTTAELLARGFDLDGTAGDDVITGTNTTDRINGLGGNDTLYVSVGDAENDEINQLDRYAA